MAAAILSHVKRAIGCGNRNALFLRLKEECLRCRRTGEPLSCITIDVDGLTKINDRFGHKIGDLVLKRVASAVRQRLRITDHFFRSGGDEFVVVATDCNRAAAQEMAADLQALVSQLGLGSKQEPVPTSISTGISTMEGDELKPDTLLARSDTNTGLIQSLSQGLLPELSAWVEVGGIASSLCSRAFLPQPISI